MRTTLLIAVMLLVSVGATSARALTLPVPELVAAQNKAAADDEEEDPVPGTPSTPASSSATAPATSGPAAPAPTAVTRLVSGAPLDNPHVAVHTVEQKQFSDSGRRELVLYPATAQINGKYSQHFGTMGSFLWYLQENFALMVTGGYNWYNAESSLVTELTDKVSVAPPTATALLSTWSVLAGVEVAPLYGKFAIVENALVRFSFVINGGAGAGGTRVQLRAALQDKQAAFGDTNVRFMAMLGAGFRLQLGSRFALRIEVRDVVYTARVERINGCSLADLQSTPISSTGSCQAELFNEGGSSGTLVSLATSILRKPSSDVLNNVGLYLGASFIF